MSAQENRTAVVTGAARGIGFAIAKRLASSGVTVALADLDEAAAKAAAEALPGGASFPVQLDVSDEASVASCVETVIERAGKIDILVNNAGIAGPNSPVTDISLDGWARTIAINLTGPFLMMRAVLPGMIERNYGRIVNVSSIAGKEGNPGTTPYDAAKAGLIGLTKGVAKEVAKNGITVNSITPAVIATEMLDDVPQEHLDYMLAKIPMGRPGRTEEVAALVQFIASDDCTYSTGACFDISGGRATY